MSTVFDVGDLPIVTALFTDVDAAPSDPTSVQVTVLKPDLTTFGTYTDADPEVTNPAVGTWRFTFPTPLDDTGPWEVKFAGLAGTVATGVIKFRARENSFD